MDVLPTCMYVYHVCTWYPQEGQKRISNTLELELWIIVSHPVGAGN